MIGAVLVYIVAIFIARVINRILLDAIIDTQVEKEENIDFQTGSIIETGDRISDSNN